MTGEVPLRRLELEAARLQPLPEHPFTAAFGVTRRVSATALISYQGAAYSVPHALAGESVWARVEGAQLVVVADPGDGFAEMARHDLARPGQRMIDASHYPKAPPGPLARRPRARTERERSFLGIGDNAERWLIAAAASGATRLRPQLEEAISLARLSGNERVNAALGIASAHRRFGCGDVESILRSGQGSGRVFRASGNSFLTDGTAAWQGFGK